MILSRKFDFVVERFDFVGRKFDFDKEIYNFREALPIAVNKIQVLKNKLADNIPKKSLKFLNLILLLLMIQKSLIKQLILSKLRIVMLVMPTIRFQKNS